MKNLKKYIVAGLATVIGVLVPIANDVAPETGFGLAPTYVGASAETSLNTVFEFEKANIDTSIDEYTFSTMDMYLTYDPTNVAVRNKGDKWVSNFSNKVDSTYIYDFKFYVKSKTVPVATYRFLYGPNSIFGFASVANSSDLNRYTISTIPADVQWNTHFYNDSGEGSLSTELQQAGFNFEDTAYNYYFSYEQDKDNRISSPFEFLDSTESKKGELILSFKDLGENAWCYAEFAFQYNVDDGLFSNYEPVSLNCTGKTFDSSNLERKYSSGTDSALTITRLYSYLSDIRKSDDDSEFIEYANLIDKKNGSSAHWISVFNVSGTAKDTITFKYLVPIEGTPFATRETVTLELILSVREEDTDGDGIKEQILVRDDKAIFNTFRSYAIKHNIPLSIMGSVANGVEFVDEHYTLEYMNDAWIREEDHAEMDYYMVRYYGGLSVQLSSMDAKRMYMGLDINRSYGDYFHAETYTVDNTHSFQVDELLSGANGSSLSAVLYTQINRYYFEGTDRAIPNPMDLYGYFGLAVVPDTHSLNSLANNLFDMEYGTMGSGLVGRMFKKKNISTELGDGVYAALLQSYGYGIADSHWQAFLSWFGGYTGNIIMFYATYADDASRLISFTGDGGDANDSNELWVNGLQKGLGNMVQTKGWNTFISGLTIAYFCILVVIVIRVASKFINWAESLLPDEALYGRGTQISYNWTDSHNDIYSPHDQHDTHEYRNTYDIKNDHSGVTNVESGGGNRNDYSNRTYDIDNTGATNVTSSGNREDHSNRKSIITNSGSTNVTSSGNREDHSNRKSIITNSGSTNVTSSGNREDHSKRTNIITNNGSTRVASTGSRVDHSVRENVIINNENRVSQPIQRSAVQKSKYKTPTYNVVDVTVANERARVLYERERSGKAMAEARRKQEENANRIMNQGITQPEIRMSNGRPYYVDKDGEVHWLRK